MLQLKHSITIVTIFLCITTFCQTTNTVSHFNKVIVSPHIQVTFVEGNEESVVIEKNSVPMEKINIEVKNNTLRIYLDGAKEVTKTENVYENGYKEKRSIYNGTVVTATVTYRTLNELSVRGEATQVCKSMLKGNKFKLKIYGESHVFLNEVNLGHLQVTIYGESFLEIKAGAVTHQKYTVYGESKVNSLGIENNTTKITAYGEADFRVNVSDEIKITIFGEASLAYRGNPKINKGLHFGEMQVSKID
ncbi:MAG: autotransporter adhesin [Chitinophagaceae bacterium]|nr:autotransporter adhesin [Chitinophagaceae bacterium]